MSYDIYDKIELSAWENVLDEYMNYHTGEDGPSDNYFKNTVLNMLPFLEGSKKIIDVGCGFGGPAKIILEEMPDVEIVGVTNSKLHYDYLIENPIPSFTVYYGDILQWDSEGKFDTAFFMQSFSHMQDDALKVFNADKVVMNDFMSISRAPVYLNAYDIYARTKRGYTKALLKAGYEVSYMVDYASTDISFDVWGPKIDSLPEEQKVGQLRALLAFYYSVILNETSHPYLDAFSEDEPPFDFNPMRLVANKG